MLTVCRSRSNRLAARLVFARSHAGSTPSSSSGTSQPVDEPRDSIFTAPESPWDHVFSDVDLVPPSSLPHRRQRPTNAGDSFSPASSYRAKKSPGRPSKPASADATSSLLRRSSEVKQRRASATAREMRVFNEMFDVIFNAVSAQNGQGASAVAGSSLPPFTQSLASAMDPSSMPSPSQTQTPSIGRTGGPVPDLFRTLRRHTSRVRWTTAIDEELDRKKERMELFDTDYDLLRWVTDELFGEVQRWDEEADRAMAASSGGGTRERKSRSSATATATGSSTGTAVASSSSGSINPSIYPHLVAHAMRIFRAAYSNPSLSLAVFNHAARVSIPSYVFGCTAPAYNELIEAKWQGWGDLEGVCNALEEMRANGVKMDGRTRTVVERVRREVGEARPTDLWEESEDKDSHAGFGDVKGVNPLARRVWSELGEVEVMTLVQRIERLALRERSRKPTSSPHEESWKSAVLQPTEDDGWSFDEWDKKETRAVKRPRWKTRPAFQDAVHLETLDDRTAASSPEGMAFR